MYAALFISLLCLVVLTARNFVQKCVANGGSHVAAPFTAAGDNIRDGILRNQFLCLNDIDETDGDGNDPVADTVSRKTFGGADVDWYVKAEDIVLKNKGNQNAGNPQNNNTQGQPKKQN